MPRRRTGAELAERGSAGRPRNTHWTVGRSRPWESWATGLDWMARGACTQADVDPAWWTIEETAPGAPELLGKARAVCRGCPVRLQCRDYGDRTGEYGVYAAETYSERVERLHRWERLQLPA